VKNPQHLHPSRYNLRATIIWAITANPTRYACIHKIINWKWIKQRECYGVSHFTSCNYAHKIHIYSRNASRDVLSWTNTTSPTLTCCILLPVLWCFSINAVKYSCCNLPQKCLMMMASLLALCLTYDTSPKSGFSTSSSSTLGCGSVVISSPLK